MSTTTTTTTTAITAENVRSLFPDVNTGLASTLSNNSSARDGGELAGYDEEQIRLMDEVCIVLDDNDNPIGSASKKTCHLMTNIDKGLLHRAFSVFLFDSQKRLLLQQRASEKITFPDMWTNTCCSHPLGVPGETGAELDAAVLGVKRAAQRKLKQELGIEPEQVPIEKFEFLTRIHYKAPSDGKWGEHEVDYILFIESDVDLAVNSNEVRDTKYVSASELKQMFEEPGLKFTPWFKLICHSMLFEWWEHLGTDALKKYKADEHQIRSAVDDGDELVEEAEVYDDDGDGVGGDEADDEAAGDDTEEVGIDEDDDEVLEREQRQVKNKRIQGMKRLPWPPGSRVKKTGDTPGTQSSASMGQSRSAEPPGMEVDKKGSSYHQSPSILQDADDEMGDTNQSQSQGAELTGMDTSPLPRETPSIFQTDDDEAGGTKSHPTDPLPSLAGKKREHESEQRQGPSKKPRAKAPAPHKTAAFSRPKRGSQSSSRE